jgi:hypothetical protein
MSRLFVQPSPCSQVAFGTNAPRPRGLAERRNKRRDRHILGRVLSRLDLNGGPHPSNAIPCIKARHAAIQPGLSEFGASAGRFNALATTVKSPRRRRHSQPKDSDPGFAEHGQRSAVKCWASTPQTLQSRRRARRIRECERRKLATDDR